MKDTKRCAKCQQSKSTSEFYKDKTRKDGLHCYCKTCEKIYQGNYRKTAKGKVAHCKGSKKYRNTAKGKAVIKRYFQSEKGKTAIKRYNQSEKGKANYKRYPNHIKATRAVNHAIEVGKMPRPDSLQCYYGEHPAQQYHHHLGYELEHWLDVVPVCRDCHRKCERKIA